MGFRQRRSEWDPRKRAVAGVVAFVVAPAVVLGGGLWTATYAISRVMGPEPAAPCVVQTVQGPVQNSFKVNVVNAGAPGGAAASVIKQLPLRKFVAGQALNDTAIKVVKGQGEIRFGPGGRDQALVVRKLLLPGATLAPDYREDTSVDLALGPQFTELAAPDGPLVYRSDVVVNVYNTTYFEGLAKSTLDGLAAMTFQRGKTGLDPQNAWVQDVAAVRYGPDGELGAKLVQEAVPGSTLMADPSIKGTAVDLLLGMKWSGLAPVAKLTPEPPRKPLGPVTIERPCEK